jgi:hypothetical protein
LQGDVALYESSRYPYPSALKMEAVFCSETLTTRYTTALAGRWCSIWKLSLPLPFCTEDGSSILFRNTYTAIRDFTCREMMLFMKALVTFTLMPWRWRQYFVLKHLHRVTQLYLLGDGVLFQGMCLKELGAFCSCVQHRDAAYRRCEANGVADKVCSRRADPNLMLINSDKNCVWFCIMPATCLQLVRNPLRHCVPKHSRFLIRSTSEFVQLARGSDRSSHSSSWPHGHILCLNHRYSAPFCSRTPRCNFCSTLYPQSCWCIIQVIRNL